MPAPFTHARTTRRSQQHALARMQARAGAEPVFATGRPRSVFASPVSATTPHLPSAGGGGGCAQPKVAVGKTNAQMPPVQCATRTPWRPVRRCCHAGLPPRRGSKLEQFGVCQFRRLCFFDLHELALGARHDVFLKAAPGRAAPLTLVTPKRGATPRTKPSNRSGRHIWRCWRCQGSSGQIASDTGAGARTRAGKVPARPLLRAATSR